MKMKKKMILLVSLLLLTAAVLGGMPQDAWADTQSKEYVVDRKSIGRAKVRRASK